MQLLITLYITYSDGYCIIKNYVRQSKLDYASVTSVGKICSPSPLACHYRVGVGLVPTRATPRVAPEFIPLEIGASGQI